MIHNEAHALAGQTVVLNSGPYAGSEYQIQDYYDRVFDRSWKNDGASPVVMEYAMQGLFYSIPYDDEVLYGESGGVARLVHIKWL